MQTWIPRDRYTCGSGPRIHRRPGGPRWRDLRRNLRVRALVVFRRAVPPISRDAGNNAGPPIPPETVFPCAQPRCRERGAAQARESLECAIRHRVAAVAIRTDPAPMGEGTPTPMQAALRNQRDASRAFSARLALTYGIAGTIPFDNARDSYRRQFRGYHWLAGPGPTRTARTSSSTSPRASASPRAWRRYWSTTPRSPERPIRKSEGGCPCRIGSARDPSDRQESCPRW